MYLKEEYFSPNILQNPTNEKGLLTKHLLLAIIWLEKSLYMLVVILGQLLQ